MDGTTGGMCQASHAIREYHHTLKERYTIRSYSHVKKLEVTEIKMCRWACGHTLRDHVRNDDIRKKLKVENITERGRKARLRWFGHVKRRDQEYVGRKTMVPPGRRKKRKTEAEMDGLCQSRHESHRNHERRSP